MSDLKNSFIEITMRIPKQNDDFKETFKEEISNVFTRIKNNEAHFNRRIEDISFDLTNILQAKENALTSAFNNRIDQFCKELLKKNEDVKNTFENKLDKLNEIIQKTSDRLTSAFNTRIAIIANTLKNKNSKIEQPNNNLEKAFRDNERLKNTVRRLKEERKVDIPLKVPKNLYNRSNWFATQG